MLVTSQLDKNAYSNRECQNKNVYTHLKTMWKIRKRRFLLKKFIALCAVILIPPKKSVHKKQLEGIQKPVAEYAMAMFPKKLNEAFGSFAHFTHRNKQ